MQAGGRWAGRCRHTKGAPICTVQVAFEVRQGALCQAGCDIPTPFGKASKTRAFLLVVAWTDGKRRVARTRSTAAVIECVPNIGPDAARGPTMEPNRRASTAPLILLANRTRTAFDQPSAARVRRISNIRLPLIVCTSSYHSGQQERGALEPPFEYLQLCHATPQSIAAN